MGRMYSVQFHAENVSGVAFDVFHLVAPSDAIVLIHSLFVGQSSEAGDAEDEMARILMHRGATAGSGGPGAETPRPLNVGDAAFGGTVRVADTTPAAEGSLLHGDAFNIRAGYQQVWTPETRPVISPSGGFCVKIDNALGDTVNWAATLYFEEIGG